MKKKYIFLGVVVAAFAGFYYFTPSFESIVKKVVHKYGSEITGTDVNLEGFKLKITSGEGEIKKITVANPKNYSTPYVFSLDGISVKVDIKSITGDTIIIDSVKVSKPVITYEMLSLTQNNISEIQKNIAKNTASKPSDSKESELKEAKKAEDGGKKIIIKDLLIDGGEIQAVTGLKDHKASVSAKLPTIHMKDIGKEKQKSGDSVAATISKVISKILSTASKTIIDSKISDLKGVAEENLNNVVGGVKDRVKEIGIFGK